MTLMKGLTDMGFLRWIQIPILGRKMSLISNMSANIEHFGAGMKIDLIEECAPIFHQYDNVNVLRRLFS